MASWEMSQRRAARLVGCDPKTLRRVPDRRDDHIRERLRHHAAERRRFGYRRLGLMLERENITMNEKKLYRLYKEEGLAVRRRRGRKRATGTRAPLLVPTRPNERWSLDFVSDTLRSGRRLRVLVVIDDATRECLAAVPDTSISGVRVARELDVIVALRGGSQGHRQRQRHRTHQSRGAQLGQRDGRGLALHRARQAAAERVRRELHRPVA